MTFKSKKPPLTLDEVLGDSPEYRIRPAMWWANGADAKDKESRLAAWAAGRDFQALRRNGSGGPYIAINDTRGLTDVFLDEQFGFQYPNAAGGAELVIYQPPVNDSPKEE